MHPHTKKVVTVTAITMGIVMFAYMIPVFIVPVALGASEAANCTDYGCANAMFVKCGGFSSGGDSASFIDSWTRGVQGMLCIMGMDTGAPNNADQIALNKA